MLDYAVCMRLNEKTALYCDPEGGYSRIYNRESREVIISGPYMNSVDPEGGDDGGGGGNSKASQAIISLYSHYMC